jgi:hypothetical protein
VYYCIKINGAYDVLCALSILNVLNVPVLNRLRLSMLTCNEDPVTKRMFAYWVFTYGIIRLYDVGEMVTLSYIVEAVCMANELRHQKMKRGPVLFCVLGGVLIIGICGVTLPGIDVLDDDTK